MKQKTAKEIILNPKNYGTLNEEENCFLAFGKSGSFYFGSLIYIQLLLNLKSGQITNVKYKAFGGPADILTAETISEYIKNKNYNQALQINSQNALIIISQYTGYSDFYTTDSINIFIDALHSAASCCTHLPAINYTPIMSETLNEQIPNWNTLNDKKKIDIIKNITNTFIMPFIEMDGGSISIDRFHENVVYISYKGQCKRCPASYGSTLEAIKSILKSKTSDEVKIILMN